MSDGNGTHAVEQTPAPSRETIAAGGHIQNYVKMVDGMTAGAPGQRRIDLDPVGAVDQLANYWAFAAEEVRGAVAGQKVDIIPASALLAEPDEDRTSHFRERFYLPAFGASCGEPRTGKGTMLLWFAFCLSLGLSLGPNLECVKAAPAIFFTNEDTRRRLRRRIRAMAKGVGIAFEDVRGLYLIAKPDPALHLPENLDDLKRACDEIGPKWITIDGLSRISTGRDMNSDAEMQPVVEAIEQLRDHYQASVELIAHTTKVPGRKGLYAVKGAGCVPAAADHLLMFELEGERSTLTFSNSRDDEDWTMSFLKQTDDQGGEKYVVETHQPDISAITNSKAPDSMDKIAETIIEWTKEHKEGPTKFDIAGKIGRKPDTIARDCKILESQKRCRINVGKGGQKHPTRYVPIEAAL